MLLARDHLSRPTIRQVCLIVRPRVEAREQINVRNIQLPQPLPQGSVIHVVECILKVQVAAEVGSSAALPRRGWPSEGSALAASWSPAGGTHPVRDPATSVAPLAGRDDQ
jgi:hypothetical protein